MANKHSERWYLEQLRRSIQDFPTGLVRDNESPDFLVQSDSRTVGVEVTVFHWPASSGQRPHQEEQALKNRAVTSAAKLHAEAGGPGLYVTVYFARPIDFGKRTIWQQSEAIANAVLESPLPNSLDSAVRVRYDRLPPRIREITVRRSIHEGSGLWSADAGGWVIPVEALHIQAVLDRKAPTAALALQKCDELWLVIVNDEFSSGAPVELATASAHAGYRHPFHRVFWLDAHGEFAWELRSPSQLRPDADAPRA